jgi:hypothetical protein
MRTVVSAAGTGQADTASRDARRIFLLCMGLAVNGGENPRIVGG